MDDKIKNEDLIEEWRLKATWLLRGMLTLDPMRQHPLKFIWMTQKGRYPTTWMLRNLQETYRERNNEF